MAPATDTWDENFNTWDENFDWTVGSEDGAVAPAFNLEARDLLWGLSKVASAQGNAPAGWKAPYPAGLMKNKKEVSVESNDHGATNGQWKLIEKHVVSTYEEASKQRAS